MAAFPVDPLSGGTWIGVNDAGLTMVLLNRTIDPAAKRRGVAGPLRSRGCIVPALLGCGSIVDALAVATTLDLRSFELFRLVMVHRGTAVVASSNGTALSFEAFAISRPWMLTSSSLGDAAVEAPRSRLFEQLLEESEGRWLDAQSRFHRHQWPSNPAISVRMERSDALTVSRTVVDVAPHAIRMCYEPQQSPHADAGSDKVLASACCHLHPGAARSAKPAVLEAAGSC